MTPMRASIVGQGSGLPLRLPLCGLMLGFRKLGDVAAGILERDELAEGQRDRIVELAFPGRCFRRRDARAPGSATRF
jgi:hypothetical protein